MKLSKPYFLRHRPKANAIKNDMKLPWLKLSLDIPTADILKEFEQVKDQLVAHRPNETIMHEQHNGWHSLTIHGVAPDITDQTEKEMPHTWTSVAEECLTTKQWIQSNFIINNNTKRIRFMYLEPGGWILPHHDRETHMLKEINVAITNPQGCIFRMMDRGDIPFTPGTAFILDVANKHMVWNDSDEPRLHIILHTDIEDKTIEESYENCYYSQ